MHALRRDQSWRPRLAVVAALVALAVVAAGCTSAAPIVAPSPPRATGTPAPSQPTSRAPSPAPPAPSVVSSPSPVGAPLAALTPAVTPAPDAAPGPVPAPVSPVPPPFRSTISPIDDALAARMRTSWRAGCPVPLADLRYVTVTHLGFDGQAHDGELVVAADVAEPVVTVFARLFEIGYPIESLRLVDDFGGSDDASMQANNSSAFNCRPVTGSTDRFSEHSYGTAIDLNPVQNPYVSGTIVLPEAGRAFLDRPAAPGVVLAGDPVVEAFAAIGWTWGGTWTGPVDYQHFSRSGR